MPLNAAHPSASIVDSGEEYAALADQLEDPPAPNEQLRRAISSID